MAKTTIARNLKVNQYHTVSAKLVHLDGENPRHEMKHREAEIIAELCDEQLVVLAADIAKRGAMSPFDVMGVVNHEGLPGHYIAVEGNRRTCAMILLSDPERAPTQAYRSIFKRIANQAKLPENVHVFLFRDRDDAQPWIELRHLGAQGGKGIREWSTNAKARASKRSTSNTTAKADILALLILERLRAIGLIDEEQRAGVPITTLSRYLNNKTRRSIFGLGEVSDDGELIFTHDPDEVDAVLQRFVLDSIAVEGGGAPRVNSRAKAKDCDAYVSDLATNGLTPTTRLENPSPPPDPQKDKSLAERSSASNSRSRSAPNPVLRNKFITSSFTVKTQDKVLSRLRQEMLRQPIEDHEFAANYLLRAFVERILVLYIRHSNPNHQHKNDADLSQLCANKARDKNAPRNIQLVLSQASSEKHIPHSLHTLGTAVHGSTFPVRKQLLAVFDTWEPALRYMLDSLHD
ncbi:hypothetical protein [Zoogloea dura]|uniref:ParB/Sulfiredoxin domain-containing protein n=1 Tax=Zoogloea dura TaxID=2728840 RepID=A0A848FWU5_9RHOO|nr:hypothetical protein [Zoogloea dura]NML24308.1 hypothetical protein [Zoogloea dura]